MKQSFYSTFFLFFLFYACAEKKPDTQVLADKILADTSLQLVDRMARNTIRDGFNAGSGYSQIWARDLNTFIETALEEMPKEKVRSAILLFFALQQKNGEIVDGYVIKKDFTWYDDTPYYADAAPDHVGFKNTVETDQETSLIQLLGKYVKKTRDTHILDEEVAGLTVRARMRKMVDYLMQERYNKEYGLLFGAMTADWGDVQPHDDFGCDWNALSYEAIDVYDNAMFIIALDYLAIMENDKQQTIRWHKLREEIKRNVRKYLWDKKQQKFIPHLYPKGNPFLNDFDENKIHYHGGTAVAIEAGLLSKEEIAIVNKQMLDNVRLSGMSSIGLTLYPTYPEGFFHGGMSKPYVYQNGGDWTWFGGRMIQQLVQNDFTGEAYQEIRPMIDRVIKNKGFFEWYGQGNVPSGSGNFKGSAGVLAKAILLLQDWAKEQKANKKGNVT